MSALLFILFIVAFIGVQGLLYKKGIFDRVEVTRGFDRHGAFPGEKVVYELSIENRKLLPLTWVSIDEKMYSGLEFEVKTKTQPINEEIYLHNTMLSLLPYQKVIRRYDLRAVKRGYYQLKQLTMTSTNMLGTEEYSVEKDIYASVAVYPRLRALEDSLVPANTIQGDISVKRWIIEDPMIITGVRSYNNDSLKSINWKATARHQKLLVNKYDYTADKKVMVILNLEKQEYDLKKEDLLTVESAIEVCASLAAALQETGIPVGFATNSHTLGPVEANVLDPDTGEKQFFAILETLAKVSYFKKYKSRELLKLLIADFSWGTEVVVVTPEITASLMQDLESLYNTRTTLISLSPSEVQVPSNIGLFYYRREEEHYEVV